MTARGPTLCPDRNLWTGSLHVVDVDGAAAAQAFAVNDPYHRAGLFCDHLIWRFSNLLGRTMWDASPQGHEVPFLILAQGSGTIPGLPVPPARLPPAVAASLVLWGALHPVGSFPGTSASVSPGAAVALLAPDEATARSLIATEPALLGGLTNWQIHAWEFGGRR
jgi:hypothetical protein